MKNLEDEMNAKQKQAEEQPLIHIGNITRDTDLSATQKTINGQLAERYIFLVDDKAARTVLLGKTPHKDEKKAQQENTIFNNKCRNEDGCSDDDSDSSVEVVEGHEVVLKTSSQKTNADDQDYLQLLEEHQQRLEESSNSEFNHSTTR